MTTSRKKRVKGRALIIDGRLDNAQPDDLYLWPILQMAIQGGQEGYIVNCTIEYALPTKARKSTSSKKAKN